MSTAFKIALVVLLAVGGYKHWDKRYGPTAKYNDGTAVEQNEFIALPAVDGHDPDSVVVMAPQNCPSDAAKRADSLAANLEKNGVTVQRTSSLHISKGVDSQEIVDRLNSVMNGPPPIVFVRGKAMANPSLNVVMAEAKK